MTSPLPQDLEELIAGYVLGNLDPQEVQKVEQLLAENPDLIAEVNGLQETLALLPYGLPKISPPTHLRTAILSSTAFDSSPEIKAKIKTNSIPLGWTLILVGIPTLLAIFFGGESDRLRQDLVTAQSQIVQQKDAIAMLQQSSTSLVALKGMDMASSASGNMVMTPGEPQAVLVLRNLPTLPEGQVYYLWAVVGDKKLPFGSFKAGSHGNVVSKFAIPNSENIEALIITVEASPSATEPAGPMVMTSGA